MKNTLIITTDNDDLVSSVDDGTNTLFINDTEIPSNQWVGSGNYTTTVEGHSITIAKIASLNGNVMIEKVSSFGYRLVTVSEKYPVYQDANGNVTIAGNLTSKDIKVNKLSSTGGGILTNDVTGYEYPLIGDNGTNLWIGARQAASRHHSGNTAISTGHNGNSGNETIYIVVPNDTNDNATMYKALHSGNLYKYIDYQPGETVTLTALVGAGYSTGTNGTYYFPLDTPKQVPINKTITVTTLIATIRGVNGLVVNNADISGNLQNMIRGTSGKPRLYLTGLTNNFMANTPAHIVCTVTFTIAS